MEASILSRSSPAAPTKGKACWSSSYPGPSPITKTSGFSTPVPGTVFVRVAARRQRVQAWIFEEIAASETTFFVSSWGMEFIVVWFSVIGEVFLLRPSEIKSSLKTGSSWVKASGV